MERGVNVYTIRDDVRCVECNNKGSVQHYGKYHPRGKQTETKSNSLDDKRNEPYMSFAVGFGGTIPHKCLNCGNVGLIDGAGLEGYDMAFKTIKEDNN